jgi:hypothetical protein
MPSHQVSRLFTATEAVPSSQLVPLELVRSALTRHPPRPPPQPPQPSQPSQRQSIAQRLLDRAQTAVVYLSLLDTKQVLHQNKIAKEYGVGGRGGASALRTKIAVNLASVVPQSPADLLPFTFWAKDLPEIRALQPSDSIIDNLYLRGGDIVGDLVGSIVAEHVASEKAAEQNGKRKNTILNSGLMVAGKFLQESVEFSPNSWRTLTPEEVSTYVEEMQRKNPDIDWARLSQENPADFSQALYYEKKKEGKVTEAHSLFAAADTLKTEVANQWRLALFRIIKGSVITLQRVTSAVTPCGPNAISVSPSPSSSPPILGASAHFGTRPDGATTAQPTKNFVDIPCSVISLDSVLSPAAAPRDMRDVMPLAADRELYDQLTYSSSSREDLYPPRDIGLRIGPLERQETDLCKVLNEFFVPIPIVLTHNYKVDTREFGLFSGDLARVINFYMHTPSEQVYALVQFDPTSDDLTFVHVKSSNYEPVDMSTVEFRSEHLNSFGRVLHLNRTLSNPKDPYKLYKKYKHVYNIVRLKL